MKTWSTSPNEIFKRIISDSRYKAFCRTDIYDFPRPYYKNIKDVKAIILGADPSNPQEKTFEFVFSLERGNKSPYFNRILTNLSNIGLNLDNIYVQNLCKNYFTKVTDENEFFSEIAEKYWLPYLKYELDSLIPKDIPVLVTAWKVIEIIAPTINSYSKNKKDIYKNAVIFEDTKLNRPVFALFRGGNNYYGLHNSEYSNYVELIKNHTNKN